MDRYRDRDMDRYRDGDNSRDRNGERDTYPIKCEKRIHI
jgi:hypothetical protein